jgi:glycosyltransferase involved in cell wall biosynthesis
VNGDVPALHHFSHPWPTGYGVAAARLIRALVDAGGDATWSPVAFDPVSPWLPDDFPAPELLGVLPRQVARPAAMVAHCVPELLPALRACRPGGTALVICTVWEADRVQDHWPDLLNSADLVVVPTRWNAHAFRAAGVRVPIEVVPHARSTDVPEAAWLGADGLGLSDEFVVHSIAAWDARKDPSATVEAFARAFGPADGARLVLKTTLEIDRSLAAPPGPEGRRRLSSWTVADILHRASPAPPVDLVHATLTRAQVAGLHARSDCWLSLPHAEGWDLGAFDAAVAGVPVVTVGHGGPLEYLGEGYPWLVPGELTRMPDLPGGRWMRPDIDAAVSALQRVAADPQGARRNTAVLAADLRARYAPGRIAGEFVAALERAGIG